MQGDARRRWLKAMSLIACASPASAFAQAFTPSYAEVRPRALIFPRDFGAHPDFRTEWWYLTGWLGVGVDAIGFQVTFFRSRVLSGDDNPSRFAARQLMFAHAALALPREGKLRHAETAGRVGAPGVSFETADTSLQLAGWNLKRTADDHYQVFIPSDDFTLELQAIPLQGPVLRGEAGYSRKGPTPELASLYYSRPQLKVTAALTLKNRSPSGSNTPQRQQEQQGQQRFNLTGSAWFDHEWSSSLLMSGAVGWDWIGINLLDGGSLMAFRIRDAAGQSLFSEWDWRDAQGQVVERHDQVSWQPIGHWRSPRSQADYPASFILHATGRAFTLNPLMADQEVDARASTGAYYYEGAVELKENGAVIGLGYLELTGYGAPLVL